MGELLLFIAMSVDGYIAGKDGDISWLDEFNSADEDYGFSEFYRSVGAVLMGSGTYAKAKTLEGGIDGGMPTYVFTKERLQGEGNLHFYDGKPISLVRELKAKTEKNIWLVGGGRLATSFLKDQLIDRAVISVIPILLGGGIPLFPPGGAQGELTLESVNSYQNGVIQIMYRIKPAH